MCVRSKLAFFSNVFFFYIHKERGYVVFGTAVFRYFKFVVKFLRRPYDSAHQWRTSAPHRHDKQPVPCGHARCTKVSTQGQRTDRPYLRERRHVNSSYNQAQAPRHPKPPYNPTDFASTHKLELRRAWGGPSASCTLRSCAHIGDTQGASLELTLIAGTDCHTWRWL